MGGSMKGVGSPLQSPLSEILETKSAPGSSTRYIEGRISEEIEDNVEMVEGEEGVGGGGAQRRAMSSV